jgi:hypothetical protein
MSPLAKKHKLWFQSAVSAPNDGDKFKNSMREMDEAFNVFMVSLYQIVQDWPLTCGATGL